MFKKIQQIPKRVFDALGIWNPDGFAPQLSNVVQLVAQIPVEEVAQDLFADSSSRGGRAYAGWDANGPVAGNFSNLQLRNFQPVGEYPPNYVYVDKVTLISPTAPGVFLVNVHDASLLNLSSSQPVSKDIRGAGVGFKARAQFRQEIAAAKFGSAGTLMRVFVGASGQQVEFNPPLRLSPNQTLVIVPDTIANRAEVTWEFRESDV